MAWFVWKWTEMMPSDSAWHLASDSSWEEDGGHVIPLPNLPIAAQISQVFLGHRKPPTWSHLKSWQGKLEGSNRRIQNGINNSPGCSHRQTKAFLHLASGSHWKWMNMAYTFSPPKRAIYIGKMMISQWIWGYTIFRQNHFWWGFP